MAPVFIDHAKGSEMWDVDGNRYTDFATGIAVCNTGHLHPKVKAAVVAVEQNGNIEVITVMVNFEVTK